MTAQPFSLDSRALSPVIGTVLMISVSIMLVSVMGATAFTGIGQGTDAPPQVSFSYEVTDDGIVVTHDGGDDLDGDRLRFAGAATEKNDTGAITEWEGETVTSGDSAVVETTSGTLKLVWVDSSGDTRSILDAASVPETGPDTETERGVISLDDEDVTIPESVSLATPDSEPTATETDSG